METTDRELLVHLVDALSDMVFCLRSELMQDRCELDDKMTLLEIASFDDSRDPVQRRVKESWDDITRAAHRQHKHARERFTEAARRVEQMKMLLQGKSLHEIDAHFKERDERTKTRRAEIRRAFDHIGNR